MPKVCSGVTDALSIFQASDSTLPVDLLVTETRPSMRSGFLDEFFHGATDRCCEQVSTGDGVVEFDRTFLVLDGFQEGSGFPVSGVFGVVTVEVADSVGGFIVTVPSQILLDWLLAGSVALLAHDFFFGHDGVFRTGSSAEKLVEKISLSAVGSSGGSANSSIEDWSEARSGADQGASEDHHGHSREGELHIEFLSFSDCDDGCEYEGLVESSIFDVYAIEDSIDNESYSELLVSDEGNTCSHSHSGHIILFLTHDSLLETFDDTHLTESTN